MIFIRSISARTDRICPAWMGFCCWSPLAMTMEWDPIIICTSSHSVQVIPLVCVRYLLLSEAQTLHRETILRVSLYYYYRSRPWLAKSFKLDVIHEQCAFSQPILGTPEIDHGKLFSTFKNHGGTWGWEAELRVLLFFWCILFLPDRRRRHKILDNQSHIKRSLQYSCILCRTVVGIQRT